MTTLGMGFFLHWLIPDLALPWAFALGAILSPTDPVAIGIVKKLGISPRVVALLEGESLLNDATALVLLRTAVGAAVVAGLITGASDVRHLSPQHRISDHQNWRTVELVLEGAVYLIMGLELTAVIHDVQENASHSIGGAVGYAALALVACLVLRAGYTVPLLAGMRRAAARARRVAPRITEVRNRIESGDAVIIAGGPRGMFGAMRHALEPDREAIRRRIRRYENDIDYMLRQNLGWREGAVVVWSGMRGVATIAAAQTLPSDTPGRSTLIFIAFLVALGTFSSAALEERLHSIDVEQLHLAL